MTKFVVLDDDPTGTQTVQDVAVLTVWDVPTLQTELLRPDPLFFILTNSRALPEPDARRLMVDICTNLRAASDQTGVAFALISRSDSTLRGHFPAEPEAIEQALGQPFDAWLLIPFFEEGGRITRHNVHYVREGERLVPAAETPFAQDATFGYRQSDLRQWVAEKTGGRGDARRGDRYAGAARRIEATAVQAITLSELRSENPQPLRDRLALLTNRTVVVVNAETWTDLLPLARAVQALPHKRFLFRTAASWVKAAKFVADGQAAEPSVSVPLPTTSPGVAQPTTGGLIVVGSYVPKTTEQLRALLLDNEALVPLELDVATLLNEAATDAYIGNVVAQTDARLAAGQNVVIYTSRGLVKHPDPVQSLRIGNAVSAGLVAVVQRLQTRPRFLVAKGGITSSDVATAGLGVRRAVVRGQLLAGVPVWETGPESRFPGLYYVVFPGNVGSATALRDAFDRLNQ